MNDLIKTERKLPKLDELYSSDLAKKQNELNVILNSPPKNEWVKVNSFANNMKYIPIEIIEYLLTSIFLKWRNEIKKTEIMANSVVVTVRLHVVDPLNGEWDFNDGIGAAPIQTDKGASATDFSKAKADGVAKAAPAAASFAIKNAAKKFGKIFGKDLNRKSGMEYAILSDREFVEKKETLPELTPDSEKWKTVYEKLHNENLQPEYFENFFIISDENKKLLLIKN